MKNLIIDIGNTHTKVAVFDGGVLIKVDHYESPLQPQHIYSYLDEKKITHSILSSVSLDRVTELERILEEQTTYIRFAAYLATTIDNQYKSPETLGLDRLAGIVGAQALYPHSNCLVIDAGTCITYDVITKQGAYYGGSISPGIHMRLKSLHAFTDKLPLVKLDFEFTDIEGTDTLTSILAGVTQGTVLELQGFIKNYRLRHPDLQVILCGGDAIFFDTRLKNSIFAHNLSIEPHLVLIGLNEIIRQQND
jgi:type III pantothenate kinase